VREKQNPRILSCWRGTLKKVSTRASFQLLNVFKGLASILTMYVPIKGELRLPGVRCHGRFGWIKTLRMKDHCYFLVVAVRSEKSGECYPKGSKPAPWSP
jgi:hypothetical protein